MTDPTDPAGRRPPLLAALLLAGSLLGGCGQSPPADPVVALFAGGELRASEVEGWRSVAPLRSARVSEPATLAEAALTKSLAGAARQHGLDRTPALAAILRCQEDEAWMQALRGSLDTGSAPPAADVEAYLEEHRGELVQPRKVRLWSILKRAPGDDPERRRAVRAAMERLRERLLAGEDFQALARQESEASNRFQGGRMGPIEPGTLAGGLEEAAFALAEGEISTVLEVPDGFVLLCNAGTVAGRTMPDEEARERIAAHLTRQRAQRAWQDLRGELLAGASIVEDPSLLAEGPPSAVVASVAGSDVTLEEVRACYDLLASAIPWTQLAPPHRRAVLDADLLRRLAAARARERGLSLDPPVAARTRWRAAGALAAAELERRLGDFAPTVAEEELRVAYRERIASRAPRPEYRFRLIRLALDGSPETLDRQVELARDLLQEIAAGRVSFAEAARRHSQHPSAEAGGDVGWWPRRQVAGLGPAVLGTLEELEAGGVSDIVQQEDLWLLQLLEVRQGSVPSYEEAAPQLIADLREARRATELARLRSEALGALGLEIKGEPGAGG